MNWDAAGAVGEIVGALAVVVTLLHLARETRRNTSAVTSAAERARNWGFAEFNERIAANPELARLLLKSFEIPMADYDELEWLRFQMFARSEVGRIQDAFIQSQLGFGHLESVRNQVDFMRSLLEYPSWRTFWLDETKGDVWNRSFVNEVNGRPAIHIGMSKLQAIQRNEQSDA